MKKWKWLAVLALAALLLAGAVVRFNGAAAGLEGRRLRDTAEMRALLSQLGWETEAEPVSVQEVTLPEDFPAVLENYNRLQKQQGFDLHRHAGRTALVYTYRVLNYPGEGEVYCTLYLRSGRLIGGDVHAASLNGFMIGLTTTENG